MTSKYYKVIIKSEVPFTKNINGTDITILPGIVTILIVDDGNPRPWGFYYKDDLDKAMNVVGDIRIVHNVNDSKLFDLHVNEYFLDFIKANINEIMEIHFEHNGKRLLINKFTKNAMENYLSGGKMEMQLPVVEIKVMPHPILEEVSYYYDKKLGEHVLCKGEMAEIEQKLINLEASDKMTIGKMIRRLKLIQNDGVMFHDLTIMHNRSDLIFEILADKPKVTAGALCEYLEGLLGETFFIYDDNEETIYEHTVVKKILPNYEAYYDYGDFIDFSEDGSYLHKDKDD